MMLSPGCGHCFRTNATLRCQVHENVIHSGGNLEGRGPSARGQEVSSNPNFNIKWLQYGKRVRTPWCATINIKPRTKNCPKPIPYLSQACLSRPRHDFRPQGYPCLRCISQGTNLFGSLPLAPQVGDNVSKWPGGASLAKHRQFCLENWRTMSNRQNCLSNAHLHSTAFNR